MVVDTYGNIFAPKKFAVLRKLELMSNTTLLNLMIYNPGTKHAWMCCECIQLSNYLPDYLQNSTSLGPITITYVK